MIGFGIYGKGRKQEIRSLKDPRLMLISPSASEYFFDSALSFETDNNSILDFQEAVEEVKKVKLNPFWRPIMDPSLEDNKVLFKIGNNPATGYSFNWWRKKVLEMSSVDGKKWRLGIEYEYYAFLVWLINNLIDHRGWSAKKAIEGVVLNSKELGHYHDSENAKGTLEPTGSREICGVFDLTNTLKILACNDEVNGFWRAGGLYCYLGNKKPLADLNYSTDVNESFNLCVGWLVLPQ